MAETSRRRERRQVPYKKKPVKAREEEESDNLKKFVGKTCHLYSVSPLWQFSTKQSSLNAYSQQLTGLLATPPATPAKRKQNCRYTGKVQLVSDYPRNGLYAVEITITSGTSVPGCSMILLSPAAVSDSQQKGFTYLPLLLVQGPSALVEVVLDWLRGSFDCHVSALKVGEACLKSLAATYATSQRGGDRGKAEGVKLVYGGLPAVVQEAGLSTISVELPYESVATLHKEHSSASEDSVLDSLQKMVHTGLHLKLSSLKLVQVSMSVLHIHQDGTIKFLAAGPMLPVLSAVQCSMRQQHTTKV